MINGKYKIRWFKWIDWNLSEIDELLDDGWEPFSTTGVQGHLFLWLRLWVPDPPSNTYGFAAKPPAPAPKKPSRRRAKSGLTQHW